MTDKKRRSFDKTMHMRPRRAIEAKIKELEKHFETSDDAPCFLAALRWVLGENDEL